MSHLPLDAHPAHAVRQSGPASAVAFLSGEEDFAEILQALRETTPDHFDMGYSAVVEQGVVDGRVWVRTSHRTFTLTTLAATVLALLVRVDAMRASDRIADAFILCARHAEDRVAAIHAWSAGIRPTEDVE